MFPVKIQQPNGILELTADEVREAVSETTTRRFMCMHADHRGRPDHVARGLRNLDDRLAAGGVLTVFCFDCADAVRADLGINCYNLRATLSGYLAEHDRKEAQKQHEARRQEVARQRRTEANEKIIAGLAIPEEEKKKLRERARQQSDRPHQEPHVARPASGPATSGPAPATHGSHPRPSHTIGDAIRAKESGGEHPEHQPRIRKGGKKDRKKAAAETEGVTQ